MTHKSKIGWTPICVAEAFILFKDDNRHLLDSVEIDDKPAFEFIITEPAGGTIVQIPSILIQIAKERQ